MRNERESSRHVPKDASPSHTASSSGPAAQLLGRDEHLSPTTAWECPQQRPSQNQRGGGDLMHLWAVPLLRGRSGPLRRRVGGPAGSQVSLNFLVLDSAPEFEGVCLSLLGGGLSALFLNFSHIFSFPLELVFCARQNLRSSRLPLVSCLHRLSLWLPRVSLPGPAPFSGDYPVVQPPPELSVSVRALCFQKLYRAVFYIRSGHAPRVLLGP